MTLSQALRLLSLNAAALLPSRLHSACQHRRDRAFPLPKVVFHFMPGCAQSHGSPNSTTANRRLRRFILSQR